MQKTEQESAKPKRKETVPYHNAAYSAFMCLLSKEIKSAWNLHKNDEAAAYWIHVMGSINGATLKKIISEEDGMEGIEYVVRDLAQEGFLGNLK
ncbi:MAG: hypothetical protein FWE23_09615, partial [Chitinivibrionia bacterium]|nr:hypothetical protein [Chitinivibrionia bacterium]